MIKQAFWYLRKKFYVVAFFFHLRETDWCNRCGTGKVGPLWWEYSNELWNKVQGDFGGHYCISCFDDLAEKKGVLLEWRPREYPTPEQFKEDRARLMTEPNLYVLPPTKLMKRLWKRSDF